MDDLLADVLLLQRQHIHSHADLKEWGKTKETTRLLSNARTGLFGPISARGVHLIDLAQTYLSLHSMNSRYEHIKAIIYEKGHRLRECVLM